MEIKVYEGEELSERVISFFTDLSEKFIHNEYTFDDDIKMGKYNLSKSALEEKYPNIDFDFIKYTEEGHNEQDELVIKYYIEIYNNFSDFINSNINQSIFIPENIGYNDDKVSTTWENIFKKISKENSFKEYKDYRNSSLEVSLAAILASIHMMGIRKVTEFFEFKKYIPCDKNSIPITVYLKFFEDYDISSIFPKVDDNKVVLSEKTKEDKEVLDNIAKEKKEDFVGQKSNEDVNKILNSILEPSILEKLIDLLNVNKKKSKTVNGSDNTNQNMNKEVFELDNTNTENVAKPKAKKLVKRDKQVENRLKEKYEESGVNEYIEDTTNRSIDSNSAEDVKHIFSEYENETKDSNGVGDVIKQKGFNNLRDVRKMNDGINVEELLIMFFVQDKSLDNIERYLKQYSCRYIKESYTSKAASLIKNIFLSKVGDFINSKLGDYGIRSNIDLTDYDYLNYGSKDIDDIYVTGKKEVLDILKSKDLVKGSYALDSKGVRKYPRLRRLLDNILIEYIKRRINFQGQYFDGVALKDYNLARIHILFNDELDGGLDEKSLQSYDEIGSKLSITKIIYALLKSKLKNREESLSLISSNIKGKATEYVKDSYLEEDKKLIKELFPNLESLKSYMSLKGLNAVFSFYSDIYEDGYSNVTAKESLVTEDAALICSLGVGTSSFQFLIGTNKIGGKILVTSKDKSIIPFQGCSVCKTCLINIIGSSWNNTSQMKSNGQNVLMSTSNIQCSYGGLITIVNPGQHKVKNSEIKVNEVKIKKYDTLSPYQDDKILENLLSKNAFNISIKNDIVRNISKIEDRINGLRQKLYVEMKPQYDDQNTNFKIPMYSYENQKIYDMNEVVDATKQYYLSYVNKADKSSLGYALFRKYKTFLKAKDLIKEVMKIAPYKEGKYVVNAKEDLKEHAKWMKYALRESRETAIRNSKRHLAILKSRVVEYHKLGGGIDADIKTPWCASFVNWCLKMADIPINPTPSSQKMKQNLQKIDKELYGAILILERYDKNHRYTGHGHITFITGKTEDKKKYICLGGNQDNRVKISKYNIGSNTAIRGGYLKVAGIYWPKDYAVEGWEIN